MQNQRLYLGWKCHLGVHVYRVVEGKFLPLSVKVHPAVSRQPTFDWGDDVLGQHALALALCQDVVDKDHITPEVVAALSKRLTEMTHRDLPWIFTERMIRELVTHKLKAQNHCFPLGIWARALDGESAAQVLST